MIKKLLVACLMLGLVPANLGRAAAGHEASSQAFFTSTFRNSQQKPVALADLRGKHILVNFWATWCVPCRAEIPALVNAYERGKSKGLVLVGVALDDEAGAVGDFVSAHDMSYPVLIGKEQATAVMRELGNAKMAVPYTVAIDPAGKIVASKFGILRHGDLERLLTSLFSEG